jgi:hypothetical protein
MMRRMRPIRPNAPRMEPMIIGARRLDLLKPVDWGCWRDTFVEVGVAEIEDKVDEMELVEVGRVDDEMVLEDIRGVCMLCWRVRTDHSWFVMLNMFSSLELAPSPPVTMAILFVGSNVTEKPSSFDGDIDWDDSCLRLRPAVDKDTTTASFPELAVDMSTATRLSWESTQPVCTFGMPWGNDTGNVFHTWVLGVYSHMAVGISWVCKFFPPNTITDVPPLTVAEPEFINGGGELLGIDNAPIIAWPPMAGTVNGLRTKASFEGTVALKWIPPMTNNPGDPFPTSVSHDAVWPVLLRLIGTSSSRFPSGIRLCHPFSAKENAWRPQYVIDDEDANGLTCAGSVGWPPTTIRWVSVRTHWGFNTETAFVDGISCHVGGLLESDKAAVRFNDANKGNEDDELDADWPPKMYRIEFRTIEQWFIRWPAFGRDVAEDSELDVPVAVADDVTVPVDVCLLSNSFMMM